jgi:predicted MarR family transcription regulator
MTSSEMQYLAMQAVKAYHRWCDVGFTVISTQVNQVCDEYWKEVSVEDREKIVVMATEKLKEENR